jgi:hypothetical protein
MYFNAFMDELAKRHSLHKEIKGTTVKMYVVLGLGTDVEVIYDAIDPDKRAYIRTGCFIPPITKDGRARFMNFLLDFNRNSTSVMSVGLMPHPATDCAFTPTWYVPKEDYRFEDWERCLNQYEGLVQDVTQNIGKLMNEWTHSLH